jgi:isopenicillin N synthase-like dioxygenase
MGSVIHTIPTIDISVWLSDSSQESRDAVVTEVRDACRTYGFFQLVGHGIPQSLQDKVFECAETFFALPTKEKMEVSMKKCLGLSNRGYEIMQGQTLQPGALPDLKEVRSFVRSFVRLSVFTLNAAIHSFLSPLHLNITPETDVYSL